MRIPQLADRSARLAVAAGVGFVIAALGLWAQNSSLVGSNYDDGIYALLAKALADGEGYVLTHLPGGIPGVKYPPLYPFSLVPFWALASSPEAALLAMKVANGIYIGFAAAAFVFLLADLRILSLPLAAATGVLGFASGSLMLVTSGLLSEPLYLVVLSLALWASDTAGEGSGPARLASVGVLAAMAALTRMAGLAVIVAVVVGLWRRVGSRRALIAAAAAAATLLPWVLFSMYNAPRIPDVLMPRYGSYAQLYITNLAGDPLAAINILSTNISAMLQTLGAKVVPLTRALPASIAGMALIALALLGSRTIFKRAPTTATYPWIYLALISVWAFPPFRFVFIVFPLLVALAAVSFVVLAERVAETRGERSSGLRMDWRRFAIAAVGVALVLVMGYRQSRALANRVWDGAQLQKSFQSRELIQWASDHAEPAAVIAFEFEPLVALYTGRTVVPNNYEPVHPWYQREPMAVEPLVQLLRDMKVDYLAVRGDVSAAAAPIDALIDLYPGSLSLIYVTGSGVLIFQADLGALEGGSGEPPNGLVETGPSPVSIEPQAESAHVGR